jgi:hypothetical protein
MFPYYPELIGIDERMPTSFTVDQNLVILQKLPFLIGCMYEHVR